jgi:hypothetical protein
MSRIIQPHSLAETVDALNDALFFDLPLSKKDRLACAKWIADRQGQPGCYADMFAGTEHDLKHGIKLFTGERITNAAARHILGEESCRALILLDVSDRDVKQALKKASDTMGEHLRRDQRWHERGWFCCGQCTPSVWRHLTAGGFDGQEARLVAGLKHLKQHRIERGAWKRFPFWYTVLALSEIDLPLARKELKHALPTLERTAARRPASPDDRFARRRQELARRILIRS